MSVNLAAHHNLDELLVVDLTVTIDIAAEPSRAEQSAPPPIKIINIQGRSSNTLYSDHRDRLMKLEVQTIDVG